MTKLYVNGDSHTAAAEAVNPHGFANDDRRYKHLGRQPHPDNLEVSWGKQLANIIGASFECGAESASSNRRIHRTTVDYLAGAKINTDWPDFIVIGWSTWERREWLWDGVFWQVNAGGIGHDWPDEIKKRYRNYVVSIDYQKCMRTAQQHIHELHLDLRLLNIKHLFFNTFLPLSGVECLDWMGSYLEPYNPEFSFYNWCIKNGFKPVYPGSYHFGADAHRAWAEFLHPYITQIALQQ
jgi:hypothetical protein